MYSAMSTDVSTPCSTSRSSSASTRGRYAYGTGRGLFILNTASGLKYRGPTCPFMQPVDGSNTSLNSFSNAVSRESALTLFTLAALNASIHGSPNRARSFGDSTNTSGSLRRWLSYSTSISHCHSAGTSPPPQARSFGGGLRAGLPRRSHSELDAMLASARVKRNADLFAVDCGRHIELS